MIAATFWAVFFIVVTIASGAGAIITSFTGMDRSRDLRSWLPWVAALALIAAFGAAAVAALATLAGWS